MTDGSDVDSNGIPLDQQMIAVGVNVQTERVVVHRGTNAIEYPLTFDGVDGDDLTVKGEVHRMWFEMYGWEWILATAGSDDGDELERFVDDVADGSGVVESMRDGITNLGGTVCNHCDNAFEAEGPGGTLGPTCPECGHPANDPKIVD